MSPVLAAEATPKGSPLWAFVFLIRIKFSQSFLGGIARSPAPLDFDQRIFLAVCHTAST